MRPKRSRLRPTIEPGIERAHGSYIATVTHHGKRYRQHGIKTLDAARAWRSAKQAELLAPAVNPVSQVNPVTSARS